MPILLHYQNNMFPFKRYIERRHPRVLARPYRTLDKNEEQMTINRCVKTVAALTWTDFMISFLALKSRRSRTALADQNMDLQAYVIS